jgi:hypothetical protein
VESLEGTHFPSVVRLAAGCRIESSRLLCYRRAVPDRLVAMLDAYQAPWEVFAGIASLGFLVAYAWVKLAERANPAWRNTAAWALLTVMLFELVMAGNGVLRQWDRTPPPMMALMACLFAAIIYLSRRFGPQLAQLPFSAVVGLQAFRLPLELVMHRAADKGIMPVAMSYSGWNFDIVSGALAVVVAVFAAKGRAPRGLIWTWNIMGSALLLAIITIAIAATPVAHAFGYDQVNTWISYPPFVWLPGFLVPAAALGHLVVWRKLLEGHTT